MRTFSRTTRFGVKRIVRDGYGRPSDWFKTTKEVHERDGHRCVFCNVFVGKGRGDTHHMRPLSRGGTTTKANLGTICDECHAKRHKHLR